MINHHISAALATERRNTFLVEAEAARRAKHAQRRRRQPRTSVARRSPLRWVLRLVAVRLNPPAPRTLNDALESAAACLLNDPLPAHTKTMNS